MLKPPFNLSGFEPRMEPIPALGEHTRAILGELGYAKEALDAFAASGVIS
jgi:itaconate CoA-transferase